MMRSALSISLTGPLKLWVEQQVAVRGFGTPEEYVRDMLRREQLRQTRAAVDANLLESLDSGDATEMTGADWDDIRRQGREQASARGSTRAHVTGRRRGK